MWEPATDIEQRMRDALRAGQQEDYFHTLSRMDLLLPIADETSPSATGSGSWATWATEERTHVLAFTSPEAMRLCLRTHAGNYRHVRFSALADAWPDPQWWLAVNPGTPIEGYLPSWFVAQVAAGDVRMPEQPRQQQQPDEWGGGRQVNAFNAAPGESWGADPAPPPYTERPAPPMGDNGLPRRDPVGGDTTGGLPQRGGGAPAEPPPAPQPAWGGASSFSTEYQPPAPPSYNEPPEAPPARSGTGYSTDLVVPNAPDNWPDENAVEDGLAAAASSGNTQQFLEVLLRAWAYLPVAEDCPPSARPGDPEFRWHTDLIDGSYTITAFTTQNRLAARYGDQNQVRTTFGRLVSQWPGIEYSLYVNPSTEVGANIPGPQVTTLVTWARTQGLLQSALEMEASNPPETVRQHQAPQPELMQKVLPHHQVAMTLERGYDRVAGFVHRYGDVQDLVTPEQLYNGLGLLREGADFAPTDDEVHVVRWMGHRTELYQVAYGGNDAASAQRNGGWIIEPPPFSGDGYAPSVGGRRIPEFKVDSVRLPHGAQMFQVTADGRSTPVATYDSDRREWIRSEVGAAEGTWDAFPQSSNVSQEQQHA